MFSAVAARRLTAPTVIACASGGATETSSFALGRSRRMNFGLFFVESASKGSEWIACFSDGGPTTVAL